MVDALELDELLDIICAYASGDFTYGQKAVKTPSEGLEPIYAALGMLGEELEATTISREYLQNLYSSINDAIIEIDDYGQRINFNEAGKQLVKENKKLLSHLNDHVLKIPVHTNFSDDKENSITYEVKFAKKAYLVMLTRVIKANDKLFILVIKDYTPQKELEEYLMQQEIDVQERERIRLAQDLHDSLGQELNAIRMFLSITNVQTKEPEVKRYITQSIQMIENAISEIRSISFNLMPASLNKGSFLDAVNELVERYNKQKKIKFVVKNECEKNLELTSKVATNLFRIIQEFFNNSIKYSNGNECSLKICMKENKITMTLWDNGDGFDETKLKERGLGLNSIRNRLNVLKADYEYNSTDKLSAGGVKLIFTIELEN